MPSRVSTATGIQEQKYPLLITLCTSSWTSRTVRAELARQAFNAARASASKSFLSSSSPSLFLTNTSLINTLSSSYRLGPWTPLAPPLFCWATTESLWVESRSWDWLRDNDAEQRIGRDLGSGPGEEGRVRESEAEQRRGELGNLVRVRSESRKVSLVWTSWEKKGREGLVWWWRKGAILRAEEVKETSSFFIIVERNFA